MVGLNVGRHTGSGRAGATGDTGLRGILIEREVGVEPEHVDCVVIPKGKNEHHPVFEGLGHRAPSALRFEAVGITEDLLLYSAEVTRDRIVAGIDAGDVGL